MCIGTFGANIVIIDVVNFIVAVTVITETSYCQRHRTFVVGHGRRPQQWLGGAVWQGNKFTGSCFFFIACFDSIPERFYYWTHEECQKCSLLVAAETILSQRDQKHMVPVILRNWYFLHGDWECVWIGPFNVIFNWCVDFCSSCSEVCSDVNWCRNFLNKDASFNKRDLTFDRPQFKSH